MVVTPGRIIARSSASTLATKAPALRIFAISLRDLQTTGSYQNAARAAM
jgi:hypothetical protein